MWGTKVQIQFHQFDCGMIERLLTGAGFRVEELVEREPYPPGVEFQSRRAYIFARKPAP